MRAFLVIAVAAALSACATPQHNYTPALEAISSPELNVTQEAQIGDDLVLEGARLVRETIFVPELMQISLYKIAPGYFKKAGTGPEGEFFIPAGGADGGSITQIAIADAPQALILRKDGEAPCVVTVFDAVACGRFAADGSHVSGAGFERRQRREFSGAPLRSLTYNGRTGSIVRIAYREQSADAPPLSNQMEYDLKDSPVIVYRGARIEVLEATSDHVKFKLLQRFQSPGR